MKTRALAVDSVRDTLQALHTLTFPSDAAPLWRSDAGAWITYDGLDPVAFLYAEPQLDGSLYFSRVGVMPSARGKGLQRTLMRRMVKDGKARGFKTFVSTTYQNPPSANNFVKEQWMTYNPATPWGAPDTIYWRKDV